MSCEPSVSLPYSLRIMSSSIISRTTITVMARREACVHAHRESPHISVLVDATHTESRESLSWIVANANGLRFKAFGIRLMKCNEETRNNE
ncbi:hypothetical protein ROHU_024995 [Labeo rohita]|uniref:Uncharacterized protein n=1 Tax=Labeo rohita TaxID=84645 RepID=A0A498MUV9_LABRO|nr:hypothetical protein ROHU_024995 [Labeo rohita]